MNYKETRIVCGKDIGTDDVGKRIVKAEGQGKSKYPYTRYSGIQGCTFLPSNFLKLCTRWKAEI